MAKHTSKSRAHSDFCKDFRREVMAERAVARSNRASAARAVVDANKALVRSRKALDKAKKVLSLSLHRSEREAELNSRIIELELQLEIARRRRAELEGIPSPATALKAVEDREMSVLRAECLLSSAEYKLVVAESDLNEVLMETDFLLKHPDDLEALEGFEEDDLEGFEEVDLKGFALEDLD